jgi:opacity protein-like surface antigen
MREFFPMNGFRGFAALVAALAVVSIGVRADVAFADDPGGEDIDVPAPAPAPAPAPPPPPPPADEDDFDLYLSGNVGGSFAKGRASGSIFQTLPDAGVAIFAQTGNDRDEDVFGGGSLGLHYHPGRVGIRAEIEGQAARGYDLGTDIDVTWLPPGIGLIGTPRLRTKVNTWAMFGNIWLDFPLTESLSLFAGGGVGFAVTDMTSGSSFFAVSDKTREDTTWAWQTGGGISIAATDWLAFDLGYRFVDLGEPDLKFRMLDAPSDLEMHLQSHDVTLGVRMNFLSF